MNKLLLAHAAVIASIFAAPASAADMPFTAPHLTVLPLSWTGCYLGAHLGGGWAQKQIADPVQLVQDSSARNGHSPAIGPPALNMITTGLGAEPSCCPTRITESRAS
jgi:outer membrane immunogenic protein